MPGQEDLANSRHVTELTKSVAPIMRIFDALKDLELLEFKVPMFCFVMGWSLEAGMDIKLCTDSPTILYNIVTKRSDWAVSKRSVTASPSPNPTSINHADESAAQGQSSKC